MEIDKLTDEQLAKYTSWQKMVFSNKDVMELMSPYHTREFSEVHVSIISACAKMFLGDVLKEAMSINPGTIHPRDIDEASSRLSRTRRILPEYCSIIKRRQKKVKAPSDVEDFWGF